MKVSGIITLTTDFGLNDPYVGIMKGVILSINRKAKVVDITHRVKAGAILQAASLIQEAYPYFPEGTVHVGVIDPGVGSDRRLILVSIKSHLFVGPDNGIFWPIIESHNDARVIELTQSQYFLEKISYTFHGRDIFAPVAAHLSKGLDPFKMGAPINDPVKLHWPTARVKKGKLVGQVVRIDAFGNLITNIHEKEIKEFLGDAVPLIRAGDLSIEGIRRTYAEAEMGEFLAMIGSSGFMELAVNMGHASQRLGLDSDEIIGLEVEIGKI